MLKHHKHLIMRAHISNPPKSADELNTWCVDVINSVGMNVLMGPFTTYSDVPNNEGYTCLAALDFSHIAIHFWDKVENPFFEFDLFSCKDFDINIPYEKLKQFGIVSLGIHYVNRDMMKESNPNEDLFSKVFTVYKTTNKITGDYYIGKHGFTDLNDGYLGSGVILKNAINKYGKNNFHCEHLKFFNNEELAFSFEKQLITEDLLQDSKCYNLSFGGRGKTHTLETRLGLAVSQKGKPGTTNGRKFYNNEVEEKLFFPSQRPIGWIQGRLPHHCRGLKNSKA